MQWTNAAVEKLISLYRAQPCLYNNRMKEYRDQTVKKQAYQFIMNSIQSVRRGTTVEDIKSKISSLRGMYSQEYAKMNSNASYKSNKWFFPLLDAFLKDFTRNASRERNRSASRDNISEVDSTVDGDNTRDSFLRQNMSTPLSFYCEKIGRESPLFVSRGRAGAPSPAPSLYGQEAEPFMGDFDKIPESKSCESVCSEGAHQYFSIPKTLSGIDPSIFDQPTLLDIEISPAPSPQQPVGEAVVLEQPSISIIRSSVVPSPNLSPIPKEDSGMNMRSSSPIRKLFANDDEVQIACEISIPTFNNKSNGKAVELRKADSAQNEEKKREEVLICPGPSTSKEVEVIKDTEENLTSTNKNVEVEVRKPEAAQEPPKAMKCAESQTDECSPSGSATIFNQNRSEPERKAEDQPGPSNIVKKTKDISNGCQDDPKPGPSWAFDGQRTFPKNNSQDVSNGFKIDPKPGPSWASDDNAATERTAAEENQFGTSRSSGTNSKQERSPKRKPYKTVYTTYEDSGSETEYFSAEEEPSPVKKKRKVSHVAHYYYRPPEVMKNEDDVFFDFLRIKYNNEVEKKGRKAVRIAWLSALD